MAPTVVAVGTVASGTTAITPAFPASIAAGDVLIGVGESTGGSSFPSVPPAGWAHVTGSPVVQGLNTQLTVIWALYDGVMTAASWGDAGDHGIGAVIGVRGCPTTGNPWDVVATAVSATSTTAAKWPGATTTVADTLVLEIVAAGTDTSTAQGGALTNAAYTSITTQANTWTLSGSGGGFAVYSGVKATAGALGQSTMTLATASTTAYMTIALKNNAAGGGPATSWRLRADTVAHQSAPDQLSAQILAPRIMF